jgi:hypothetical protein
LASALGAFDVSVQKQDQVIKPLFGHGFAMLENLASTSAKRLFSGDNSLIELIRRVPE